MGKPVLIVNNVGIGNGVIIDPILRTLEGRAECYHQENLWLRTHLSEFRALQGFYPSAWRRFEEGNNLLEFMHERSIPTLINIRKEDPKYDTAYLRFKEHATAEGFKLIDFYTASASNELCIGMQAEQVFREFDPHLPSINWRPYKSTGPKPIDLVVYLGSSLEGKSLRTDSAAAVCNAFGRTHAITATCGVAPSEHQLLDDLAAQLNAGVQITYAPGSSIEGMKAVLADARSVLTGDTVVSHVAGLFDIPVVTVFNRTLAHIWRHTGQSLSTTLQSAEALACGEMKVDGTCQKYYAGCTCNGADIDNAQIVRRVASQLFGKVD